MDIKHLRPRVFVADPESGDSKRQWKHWFKSFTTYIAQMQNLTEADKLNLLVNHIDAAVYEIISEAASFEDAVELLSHTYAKSPSPIFARYAQMTCKQKTGESLDSYLQKLKLMSIDCNFQAVTALIHKEEAIRDAFIGGLVSNEIRQRLLENKYQYEIIYRPGKLNVAADTLSCAYCANLFSSSLYEVHAGLCHPGITRTYHFVKSKNLPFSLDDVRKVVTNCKICAEIKPNFCKPPESHLIKATQPMERLSIDFKGHLPSTSKNKYMLTVVDEYSRYPFAFPCSNMESQTVASCCRFLIYLVLVITFILIELSRFFRVNLCLLCMV